MNAEFNWWLLIVGLVVGAGLVWLVLADWSRREEDLSEDERTAESAWIAQTLQDRGEAMDPAAAEEVLALHRAYLRQTGVLESAPEPAETTDADAAADIDHDRAADAMAEPDADLEPESMPGTTAADLPPDDDRPTLRAPNGPGHADDRPSVRSTPLSPRGGPSGLESEPPA